VETCENCGTTIADSQIPQVWHDRVVCQRCHEQLVATETHQRPPQPVPATPLDYATPSTDRRRWRLMAGWASVVMGIEFLTFIAMYLLLVSEKQAGVFAVVFFLLFATPLALLCAPLHLINNPLVACALAIYAMTEPGRPRRLGIYGLSMCALVILFFVAMSSIWLFIH
jgi:hypothetical protein